MDHLIRIGVPSERAERVERALAVTLLQLAGTEDTNTQRVTAKSVIEQIARLGGEAQLDPVLGGYDPGERDKIIEHVSRADSADSATQKRQLAETLLDKLVDHLRAHPRDVGSAKPEG